MDVQFLFDEISSDFLLLETMSNWYSASRHKNRIHCVVIVIVMKILINQHCLTASKTNDLGELTAEWDTLCMFKVIFDCTLRDKSAEN